MSYHARNTENNARVNFVFIWDKFTVRGFVYAFICMLILLLIFTYTKVVIDPFKIEHNSHPIILLNFGEGDGTGKRKGNLTAEGISSSGKIPSSHLEDASKDKSAASANDPSKSNSLIAKDKVSESNKTNEDSVSGGGKTIGNEAGTGTGLGDKGIGTGKGLGLGDIEWGGGGNRTVLSKVLPKSPNKLDRNVQIKVKFTVLADGTVANMKPMQKGDPLLEQQSLSALKRWRFNKIADGVEMSGIITFSFKMD
jgi:Gram-negative bacterial TonB protein C-terminal